MYTCSQKTGFPSKWDRFYFYTKKTHLYMHAPQKVLKQVCTHLYTNPSLPLSLPLALSLLPTLSPSLPPSLLCCSLLRCCLTWREQKLRLLTLMTDATSSKSTTPCSKGTYCTCNSLDYDTSNSFDACMSYQIWFNISCNIDINIFYIVSTKIRSRILWWKLPLLCTCVFFRPVYLLAENSLIRDEVISSLYRKWLSHLYFLPPLVDSSYQFYWSE